MKSFLKKDVPSFLFVASLILLGFWIGLLFSGNQTDKGQIGAILSAFCSLCLAVSMFLTISKQNKEK